MEIKCLASSSAGNAYIIDDGSTSLLIEAGIRFKDIQRGSGFRIAQLAGCLLTHEHLDHSKAAKDVMKAGVPVYTSAGTIEALGLTGHRVKPIQALRQFTIGTWTVLPFDTVHDAEEPLGFLLVSRAGARVLYLTDTAYCKYRFNGLTHLLIEANYALDILRENVANGTVPVAHKVRVMKSHMSLETAKGFLKANDLSAVREIHLIHLSDQNSDAARFRREVMAATGKPVYVAGE